MGPSLKLMIEIQGEDYKSAEFAAAVQSLRLASTRSELDLKQIQSPANLAKHVIAFSADVKLSATHGNGDLGTGRFVLLHEDEVREQWGSKFRVVCFAKSPLETDIGADAMIADVCWSWLTDALAQRAAQYVAASGTATRVISSGFGTLANQSDHAELEMRSSWSPLGGQLASHFEAWQDLVCMMSGYPALPQGVVSMESKLSR